jgi:general secretion pathway protein B
MSYILDALKKSEAERSRGSVPTLLMPQQTRFRSNTVIWILLAALIVNACLFAAWIFWSASTTSASGKLASEPAAVRNARPNEDITPRAESPNSTTQPATAQDDAREEMVPAQTEFVSPTAAPTAAPTFTPDEPRFSFSTHVYATDPAMRAVTMNGKRFVEGDTISTGVRIKEITETGVVLDIDGREVPMDVLQDWR